MESKRRGADEAPDALAMISQARAAVANRLVTPWWYHPALGVLMAAYLVALSLGGPLVTLAAVPVFFAGLAFLMMSYQRMTGVWVWGYAAGRATRWAVAMGVVASVGMLASWIIASTTSLVWPTLVIGAVVAVAVVVLGRRFDVALRAELRSGA